MSNGCSGMRTTFAPPAMPGVQGDPAGVAAHHLDDEDPVVGLGGGVQPVDRLGRDVHRRVEAEGEVGAGEVVVDGLGYADHIDAEVGQLGRDPEGVLAADRDQRVDAVLGEVRLDLLHAAVDLERVGPRGPQDRAATRQDPAHLGHPELHGDALERAAPSVTEADEVVVVVLDPLADHRPDHRVQPRAVASAGQHSHAHRAPPSSYDSRVRRTDPSEVGTAGRGSALIVPNHGRVASGARPATFSP